MKLSIAACLITTVGTLCFAEIPSATSTAAPAGKAPGPCKQILASCEQAGFVKGEWKIGKGLYRDCLNPILDGKSVSGVSADPSIVSACQAAKAKHQAKKAAAAGTSAPPAK